MFDFGVGYSEIFVLALVAVVAIGPKDLPRVLRTVGKFMAKARGMAREFQTHVDSAMKDTGLDELKKEAMGLKTGITSELSAPKFPGAAASVSNTGNDFAKYFGDKPEPGVTHVAGMKVEAEPVSNPASNPA